MCEKQMFRKMGRPDCYGHYDPGSQKCDQCICLECSEEPVNKGIQEEAMR